MKAYYRLTKPGIVYGNTLAALGAFLFAANGDVVWGTFAALVIGTAFIIAAGCTYNNYLDRRIDKLMARTKKRELVTGAISVPSAMVFGSVLCVLGFLLLILFTNLLTALIGFIGIFSYVVLYGIAKRHTPYSTLIGTIPGAVPPVAGYTAVTGRLDVAALILFLTMALWQIPHFYALGIFRRDDYAAAGLPIWSVKKGIVSTKWQMLFYIVLFIVSIPLLTIFSHASYSYLIVMMLAGLVWLWLSLEGFGSTNTNHWARRVFMFSLLVLLFFCVMLALDSLLP